MRRARRWALALTAVSVLGVSGCSSDGVHTVADDSGFRDCVEKAGASLDGSKDWNEKEQLAFWDKSGTLDCALDELDPGQRKDALAPGFPDPNKGDRSYDATRQAQQAVLGDWAARAGKDESQSDAARRAGALLASLWVADQDEPAYANGMEMVMAFSLYVAYYGQPTGFDDYVANDAGTVTDPSDQKTHFIDRMEQNSSNGPLAQEWKHMSGLMTAIDDAYDEARDPEG